MIGGEPIDDAKLIEWASLPDETDLTSDDMVVLPTAFKEAVFRLLPSGKQVEELVIKANPPADSPRFLLTEVSRPSSMNRLESGRPTIGLRYRLA